jgi:hypothetical protein
MEQKLTAMRPVARGVVVKFTDTPDGFDRRGADANFPVCCRQAPRFTRLRMAATRDLRRRVGTSAASSFLICCACFAGLFRGDDIEILAT